MDTLKVIATCVGLLALAGIANSRPPSPAAVEAPPPSPCKSDWTKCENNSDMANNYEDWYRPRGLCKRAANEQVKYGDPVWSAWSSFRAFRPGTDFAMSGIATLIERDAQFQNAYGAMVHMRVVCTYDLRTKLVTNIDFIEKR